MARNAGAATVDCNRQKRTSDGRERLKKAMNATLSHTEQSRSRRWWTCQREDGHATHRRSCEPCALRSASRKTAGAARKQSVVHGNPGTRTGVPKSMASQTEAMASWTGGHAATGPADMPYAHAHPRRGP